MDFDDAKENIQPLAQGRNASILHASLRVESSQELLTQRKLLEKEIHDYAGDDPLSVWYNYIEWIEQSFPSGGKESGLQEVLSKCLAHFDDDERYKQDRRMIKLYIKFIDTHKDPAECYQQLFNSGIGTMVADFYIAWAYCYDLVGNTRKADEIFLRGITCRAQPLEELQEARQHFGFAVAQRLMYKDDEPMMKETNRQLQERRVALTSLRSHRRKHVSSIRTGSAIKHASPGKVKIDMPSTSSQRGNSRVEVLKDENENPNALSTPSHDSTSANEAGKSVVRSMIDAARDQENRKEPGPWNKANSHKKGKLFGKSTVSHDLGFEIHEDEMDNYSENLSRPCIPPIPISDDEIKFDRPFIYPAKFCAISKPIKGWITPVTTEVQPDANTLPVYNKCKLYPRPNMEFQPEELKAYNIFKKRDLENCFTKERDEVWSSGAQYNIRLYPHFSTKSKDQTTVSVEKFFMPEKLPGLKVAFEEIYNIESKIERQFEEILASRIKRNETIMEIADMEETMCMTSEKIQRRKSFFPLRKSMAPVNLKPSNRMSIMPEQFGSSEKSSVDELASNSGIVHKSSKVETTVTQIGESLPSADSKILLKNKETHNLSMPKESETESEFLVATEKVISKVVPTVPFEIFKDESVAEVKCVKNTQDENDFQFKTPALPIPSSASAAAVPRKLPFEIYDEENMHERSAEFHCAGTGSFFDAEETCSTQTFNIFLKAQSVSTPKAAVKVKPLRQFGNVLKEAPATELNEDAIQIQEQCGNVLKEVTPSEVNEDVIQIQKQDANLLKEVTPTELNENAIQNQKQYGNVLREVSQAELKKDVIKMQCSTLVEHTGVAEIQNTIPAAAVTLAYSPVRERLSTILETSEHGTTQGTHTTGATTKSTFSSPEFDVEPQFQTPANVRTNQPHTVLETVRELSCQTPAEKMMESLKISHNDNNISKKIETPVAIRLQNICTTDGLEKSIFDLSIKGDEKRVGNFSRLEEKEDTAAGLILKTLPSIRFQDDKTETIPHMLISSQQFKFQDDKTETISRVMLETPSINQEEKTENISKILVGPPQSVKYPEDKTETISKFMSIPPRMDISEINQMGDQHLEKEKSSHKSLDPNDSFEFFGQTPPRVSKQILTKQVEKCSTAQVRTAAECFTPLAFESKRFCGKDTPVVLFEDELQSDSKNKSTVVDLKNNMKESFLSDFLFKDENQRSLLQNKPRGGTNKSVFRDSFMPDFSLIEDSKPQTEQIHSKSQLRLAADESILPEFSFIKNNQTRTNNNKSQLNSSRNISSLLADNKDSSIKLSQPAELRNLQQSFFNPSSASKNDLIKVMEINKTDTSINRKQISKTNNDSQIKQDSIVQKNNLMDTFMKDFSEISEPQDGKKISLVNQFKNNSSLRFLDESVKIQKNENSKNISKFSCNLNDIFGGKDTKLKFRTSEAAQEKISDKEKQQYGSNAASANQFFELNCETEMFGTNVSMIKNSTWLPDHGPSVSYSNPYQAEQIQQKSLHIKCEELSTASITTGDISTRDCPPPVTMTASRFCSDVNEQPQLKNDLSVELNASELALINAKTVQKPADQIIDIPESPDDNYEDNNEMSIYYKQTPKTPKQPLIHIWDDSDALERNSQNNNYVHADMDLNHTHQVIENLAIDPNLNPFNVDVINAFLEQHYVISYLETLPTCKLVGCIQRLRPKLEIDINGTSFSVVKMIGEGAYGAIFCGKETSTGKLVAMKQEKPPNFWEYYICLEIQERISCDEMLQSYMSVDYALIGNNSSILISKFSDYGSLITVCNKIKKYTMKNVDEYVVMLLASELLEMLDHLHAVNIIHADVKADNFLLMNKLTYPPVERHLQLIDFGVSIDMQLFKDGQTFSFVHNENTFKCPEMREGRPWTYQLDLYGLAGVIHVLLFGKYMDIERQERGFWMHKTRVPRYINKTLWDEIFKALLNIRDCKSMPNLQDLRALLKNEMEEKEMYVLKMVNEFNRALVA